MRKYTSKDYIRVASGQYLCEYVDTLEEVTKEMLWEPLQDWAVDDVCEQIEQAACLMAEAANKAVEEVLNETA